MSFATCKTILFVDFENKGVDLKNIPDDVFVAFFFGTTQKSVPKDLLKAAHKLGERFMPIDMEGQGKNALDFHIAFYLGEYLVASPKASCVILSGDSGFDPLVKHLCSREFSVRRVEALNEVFAQQAPSSVEPPKVVTPVAPTGLKRPSGAKPKAENATVSSYGSVLEHLKEMPRPNLPKKRKALMSHLNNHFAKKISEAELKKVVNRLLAEKKIRESEGKMAYQL